MERRDDLGEEHAAIHERLGARHRADAADQETHARAGSVDDDDRDFAPGDAGQRSLEEAAQEPIRALVERTRIQNEEECAPPTLDAEVAEAEQRELAAEKLDDPLERGAAKQILRKHAGIFEACARASGHRGAQLTSELPRVHLAR